MAVILSTSSSFGEASPESAMLLAAHDLDLVLNPLKRKLTEGELLDLLNSHKPIGLLAGLEPITEKVLVQAQPYLRVVSRVGVGMNNVDLDAAKRHGIRVINTVNVIEPAVAEFTIGLALNLARKISLADREMHEGRWTKELGITLIGKSAGVVGCGNIGKRVAILLLGLGMCVQVYDPAISESWCTQNNINYQSSLDALLESSDLVSLHLPLVDETRNLLSRERIQHLKPGTLLINTSRGEILDEKALLDGLKDGRISGAALDVFATEPYSGPLAALPNVILTPHVASYARETRIEMEILATKNLLSLLEH